MSSGELLVGLTTQGHAVVMDGGNSNSNSNSKLARWTICRLPSFPRAQSYATRKKIFVASSLTNMIIIIQLLSYCGLVGRALNSKTTGDSHALAFFMIALGCNNPVQFNSTQFNC